MTVMMSAAIPVALEHCHAALEHGDDHRWPC